MFSGFININKAADMTSHDVVNRVRKIFNTKKVGHAGTLDPFATGVLPIAVGRATGFLQFLSILDKSYRAQLILGLETDSGDLTGKVIHRCAQVTKSTAEVKDILSKFVGQITQTPPKYSAIKVNGHKAYELARKGVEFELPTRDVTINKIELVAQTEDSLTIDVDCSKGTYIRSLAVDIGHTLGTGATLKTLQRTRVGNFHINAAVDLNNLSESALIPVEDCLHHLPKIVLPAYRQRAFFNGLTSRLEDEFPEGGNYRVYCNGDFIGTGTITDGELKSTKLL